MRLMLVLRQLQAGRVRTLLTWLGIGAVLAVILVLQGFEQGAYAQLRAAVLDRGGELIATQAGVSNVVAARSVIPQMARAKVEAVAGVEVAHPMTALSVIYEKNGKRTAVFLFVYDSAGGPQELVAGRHVKGEREIVIDRALAEAHGLAPGDEFVIADFPFEIAGVSNNTAAFFTPFAFVNYEALIDFYFESNLAADISAFPLLSYLLIELKPGADRDAVATQIEQAVAEVDVFRPEQIAHNDAKLGESIIGLMLGVLIGVGYLAGVLVVGLFMFAATSARRRALGVLKALGFSNRSLFGNVVMEATLLTAAAIPLGIAAAHGVAAIVHRIAPVYLVLPTEPRPLLTTLLASFGFAIVGALAPLQSIRRLEPARVFQS